MTLEARRFGVVQGNVVSDRVVGAHLRMGLSGLMSLKSERCRRHTSSGDLLRTRTAKRTKLMSPNPKGEYSIRRLKSDVVARQAARLSTTAERKPVISGITVLIPSVNVDHLG